MTKIDDCSNKFCVVGAGSSGLAVARHFVAARLPFDCLEREDDVGGNWYYGKPHSSVYESTHLISSKRLTEYVDFRMPTSYPAYPSHRQVWEYLRSYARHFGLYENIELKTPIERIEPVDDAWLVILKDGRRRKYRGVVIANGHNWDPKWPEYPGKFDGQILHSAQYKVPDVFRGRRVLVVGGGNSGCDIAVEASQNATAAFHSLRRGYHYVPKFFLGRPTDRWNEQLLRYRLPLIVRRALAKLMARIVLGRPREFGLPEPDHRLFETHPIINSQLVYAAAHGRIAVKPDIAELCGDQVRFVDGSREPIDVIVYCSGYRISFPFIDREHLNYQGERPELYLNIFHPTCDTLGVCGLIQPDSGQFGLVDYQAQLLARFFVALACDPIAAEKFRRRRASDQSDLGNGIRYVHSSRHLLEVEHFSYRRTLQRHIARFPQTHLPQIGSTKAVPHSAAADARGRSNRAAA